MIQDKTPRELRVKPSASVKGSALNGIAVVVIGVKDLDAAIASFRKAYGLVRPRSKTTKNSGQSWRIFRDAGDVGHAA